MDHTASFDTQAIPSGRMIMEISWFFHFLEISDLWCHLAIFSIISKKSSMSPLLVFVVKTIEFQQFPVEISTFLKCDMNSLSQFERNFGEKSQCSSWLGT